MLLIIILLGQTSTFGLCLILCGLVWNSTILRLECLSVFKLKQFSFAKASTLRQKSSFNILTFLCTQDSVIVPDTDKTHRPVSLEKLQVCYGSSDERLFSRSVTGMYQFATPGLWENKLVWKITISTSFVCHIVD